VVDAYFLDSATRVGQKDRCTFRGMVCTSLSLGYTGEDVPGEFTKRNKCFEPEAIGDSLLQGVTGARFGGHHRVDGNPVLSACQQQPPHRTNYWPARDFPESIIPEIVFVFPVDRSPPGGCHGGF
jgi:hypothetical protein